MSNLENSNNDKNAVKPFFALDEGFNNLMKVPSPTKTDTSTNNDSDDFQLPTIRDLTFGYDLSRFGVLSPARSLTKSQETTVNNLTNSQTEFSPSRLVQNALTKIWAI
jgi:hypothetical protein